MRALSTAVSLTAVLTTGCFAEIAGGVTPRFKEQITDGTGATNTKTNVGWTIALLLGFHLDYRSVGIGYSPLGASFTRVPSDSPDVISGGHHVRLDVDLPKPDQAFFRRLLSVAYTSVNSVTVDASGNMSATSSPDLVNGKAESPTASGRSVFVGVSLARRNHNAVQLTGSVGLSYLSATSIARADNSARTYVPGVEASGLGLQFRYMVGFQPDIRVFRGMKWKEMAEANARYGSSSSSSSGSTPAGPTPTQNCTRREIVECNYGPFGRQCTSRHVCD